MQIDVCSSLGQNLSTSTYVGEIIFAIIVATLGLVLFGLLIGNMQVTPPISKTIVDFAIHQTCKHLLAFQKAFEVSNCSPSACEPVTVHHILKGYGSALLFNLKLIILADIPTIHNCPIRRVEDQENRY